MLSPEDKQLISEYMGLFFDNDAGLYFGKDDDGDPFMFHFDSNDASLCVQKMVEKGDWYSYLLQFDPPAQLSSFENSLAKLFNADNFFQAMASWLKGKKSLCEQEKL